MNRRIDLHRQTALLKLLQLVSPCLPVGGFAYSHGLEAAVEQGWVTDPQSCQEWMEAMLQHAMRNTDVPLLQRCWQAAAAGDIDALQCWNNIVLANRETKELLLSEVSVGRALCRLLKELEPDLKVGFKDCGFVCAFAAVASHWQIAFQDAALGYLWSWAENQVQAAIKLIPMGQTAGQHILACCREQMPELIDAAMTVEDEQIGMNLPGVCMASALHETQYSRLFRS